MNRDKPRILVACEYSGIVRDAFAARGWEAWSCDLLESERPGGNHYQGDIRDLLEQDWDLMVAHPPCTYLSNSGVKHLYLGKTKADKIALGYQKDPERWRLMEEGAAFFNLLWEADIPHIAIENPVMHGHGIERVNGRATQFVQPWMFGHPESKRTGLRLKNLPDLVPTDDVEHIMKTLPTAQANRVHMMSPGVNRWKERSRTFQGIGDAMAAQWGPYVEERIEGFASEAA